MSSPLDPGRGRDFSAIDGHAHAAARRMAREYKQQAGVAVKHRIERDGCASWRRGSSPWTEAECVSVRQMARVLSPAARATRGKLAERLGHSRDDAHQYAGERRDRASRPRRQPARIVPGPVALALAIVAPEALLIVSENVLFAEGGALGKTSTVTIALVCPAGMVATPVVGT